MTDILDRLEYVAGPWQDVTLADDAKKEIERLREEIRKRPVSAPEQSIALRGGAEKLAAWMIANSFATGHGDTMEHLLRELTWQVEELRARAAFQKR